MLCESKFSFTVFLDLLGARKDKMKLLGVAVIVCMVSACLSAETKFTMIRVTNGGRWGSWGHLDLCPEGSRADGFALKVEFEQDRGDDTALNGIRLYCGNENTTQETVIESASGGWGNWGPRISCRNGGFLTAFTLKVEPDGGENNDDTAANSVKFLCDNGDVLDGMGGKWGVWGDMSGSCSDGICAMQTKVESDQGDRADDTALNDVEFLCC